MVNERHELYLLLSYDSLNHVIVIIVLKIDKVLVSTDKDVVTQLGFKVKSQSFNSVGHRVRSLDSWQVLQELWIHSHFLRFFVKVVI